MNASKENAKKALEYVKDDFGEPTATQSKEFVVEFLEAAEKKLPKEESFEKQKKRSKLHP